MVWFGMLILEFYERGSNYRFLRLNHEPKCLILSNLSKIPVWVEQITKLSKITTIPRECLIFVNHNKV